MAASPRPFIPLCLVCNPTRSKGTLLTNNDVANIVINALDFQFFAPNSNIIYTVFTSPDVGQHDPATNRAFW